MEITEEVRKFHEKHGVVPDADGWYEQPRNKGSVPVTNEKFLQNITDNMARKDLAVLTNCRYDKRTFVMCCGGPSLTDYLDEIRRKSLDPDYLVVCSNMTGRYLLENNIVPNVHFIIDSQPKKVDDVSPESTHPDTEYWIAVNCDPSVGDSLAKQGRTVKYFFCASNLGGERLDEARIKECMKAAGINSIVGIGGGTMAGLRAINIAEAKGFRKFEYYGFDGSIQGADKVYAYDKTRREMMVEVRTPDNRIFNSTTILSDQAMQFLDWERRLAWIDFKIYGNGFIAAMQECQREIDRAADPQVDFRISDEYLKMQKELHDGGKYGVVGKKSAENIFVIALKLLKKTGHVSILDYGCGKGSLKAAMDEFPIAPGTIEIREYDPAISGKDAEPEPADIVICTDVLEHVEPPCTQATLKHIASLTKYVAFLHVCVVPAVKTLPDGRNAHINLRKHDWWFANIKKYFMISDHRDTQTGLTVIGEKLP